MGNLEATLLPQGVYGKEIPFLRIFFLICAEGLSALIRELVEQGALKGIAAYALRPTISHIFFANDCSFFAEQPRRIALHYLPS